MKAIILAGGLGSRLSEETQQKPKPMVEIGGRPILWHIMKMYSHHGINDFVVCCGYKGYVIKEYFANYFLHMSDVTFDLANNRMDVHERYAEPWRVTLVDTGDVTQTGGRLRRVRRYVSEDDAFCFTYGDGVGDIDIAELVRFHKSHGRQATLTSTRQPGRFGALQMKDDRVLSFREKPDGGGGMVNGGFFVLSPAVFDLIESDETVWEAAPLEALARQGELRAFRHEGFWQPMDTLRDKNYLEQLWQGGAAPWKSW
ncbi:glucose-1-phosphate cytidylyltransferase [Acidovorax sp. GBBC 3334]|uniref:glucose-1-phosphate cytidylyltransferase n=1 Tax=Acidovorax sp. GBBC 3334 TaxID=2940496 RepID=UPI0023022ED2|nr:glucose-1-phosphate cytidylyltransferase [Acidovorax sp. GBBC 3334]MDA8455922.1 glucose-1-phosphate cytidylyltransferase [Acidovorax sp. GBBC 3334]